MDVCSLPQESASMLHRHMPASPETFCTAIAPSRDTLVVAVACLCTWYWLADLGAPEGLPFGLGHALSLQALPGGQATNDPSDAHTLAVLLRGGMLPQASVDPAAMRATRALLRRRRSLTRTRAAWLAPLQNPTSQSHLPEIGTKLADQATRAGGAERLPALAGPKSLAGDLALLGSDAPRRRALEWHSVKAAQPHAPNT
jgi:hypothetical protein